MCSLAIAGFTFTSCSDDDNETNDNTKIEGTYELEQVNTEEATDFDKNGTSHIDQTEESDCYDAGKIVLNSDNTFTYVKTEILVNEAEGTAGCASPVTYSGTWSAAGTGTQAVITGMYEDNNGDDQVVILSKDGKKLTLTDDTILSRYPDRNNDGGAIYTSGSIEYVFEK